jgi:hypothetical protein
VPDAKCGASDAFGVIARRHSRSKNGVASLAYGDDAAIQPRAKRAN